MKRKLIFAGLGFVILGCVLLVGLWLYKWQENQSNKVRLLEEVVNSQKQALENTSIEIERIGEESQMVKSNAESLKNQLQNTEKKLKEEIKEYSVEGSKTANEESIPDIIRKWKPHIGFITCSFLFRGETYLTSAGSAGAFAVAEDSNIITTNKHVVMNELGYSADICNIVFPGSNEVFSSSDIRVNLEDDKIDFAVIFLKGNNSYLEKINKPQPPFCYNIKPELGEKVVILGYPGISSDSGITATEGIISGYEGDYFITSAKVEHGNSGGAAILVKRNCFLGIPSFVRVGEVESLARILDINKMFPAL
ncbi:trypsin-like peptidase domain-containing protein [Candidatus Peregrinibacteria bacterium]|nr:trypsin-like peptidase domain-containing protein [Candidatus Peregrinibacteria bacterium]